MTPWLRHRVHLGALELWLGCFVAVFVGDVAAVPLGVGEVALLCGSSTLSSFIMLLLWCCSNCCLIWKCFDVVVSSEDTKLAVEWYRAERSVTANDFTIDHYQCFLHSLYTF